MTFKSRIWIGNRNCIKGERRRRLATECEGDVGALGTIHLDTPSPSPDFYIAEWILVVMRDCGGIIMRGEIHVSSANVARRAASWVGMSAD